MKEKIKEFFDVYFNGVTVRGTAIWLRSLTVALWGAVGGVILNAGMQWTAGTGMNKGELIRAALAVAIPVLGAYLWKSPIQSAAREQYIAPRNLPDEDKK